MKFPSIAACLALSMLCGCGSNGVAPVSGTVTYRGKLLDHGQVILTPEQGGNAIAAGGGIAADGSYTISTGGRPGAPLGKYVVTVYCPRHETSTKVMRTPGSLVPERYTHGEQSPLRLEVKAGKNSFPISLE